MSDLLRDGTLLILTFGYAGVFAAMLIEGSGIPLPFPGPLFMTFVGYTVWKGHLGLLEAGTAAATGYTLGAWLLYRLARGAGPTLLARYGQRLALTQAKLTRAESWFKTHAGRATFFARMTPGVRVYISMAAGLERMRQTTFLIATFAGAWIWMTSFVLLGWAMGEGWRAAGEFALSLRLPALLIAVCIVLGAILLGRKRDIEQQNR